MRGGQNRRDGLLVILKIPQPLLPQRTILRRYSLAIAGVAAFLGLVSILKSEPSLKGTALLLGTPAEEGGGGKLKLIAAGAYKDVSACLMTHPFSYPGNVAYG